MNQPHRKLGHADVKRYYDGVYYGEPTGLSQAGWHALFIASRLGDLEGRSALDVACGTGEWLEELQRRGASVTGVDISTNATEACRRRLPGADVREAVAEALPFESATFDLVTCLGSLEHFLDQMGALREMVRVSRPGATILILVPNAGFLTRRLGLYGGTHQQAIRETIRSIETWRSMLEASGLVDMSTWRDLHVVSWDWITRGAWWVWPARALQAATLLVWPLRWQYQVYFRCTAPERAPTSSSECDSG